MALEEFREQLAATAAALAEPGTGLLAADESTGTIGKRFEAIGLENNEDHRRAYRSLLATAPGLAEHISGVILFEETLFQDSTEQAGGQPLVELFQQQAEKSQHDRHIAQIVPVAALLGGGHGNEGHGGGRSGPRQGFVGGVTGSCVFSGPYRSYRHRCSG